MLLVNHLAARSMWWWTRHEVLHHAAGSPIQDSLVNQIMHPTELCFKLPAWTIGLVVLLAACALGAHRVDVDEHGWRWRGPWHGCGGVAVWVSPWEEDMGDEVERIRAARRSM